MLGTVLVFCFFGFCAGGHWHHPRPHHHAHPGPAVRHDESRGEIAHELVPSDWRAEPGEAHERKFVSPSGTAELHASWAVTSHDSVAAHMRDVAFEHGEKLSYIQGGSDWIAVAGIRDDRQFYRQAVLACEGRRWHQIEIDYPLTDVRPMAKLVARSSRALAHTRNAGCEDAEPSGQPATARSEQDGTSPAETTGAGIGTETAPAPANPPDGSASGSPHQ